MLAPQGPGAGGNFVPGNADPVPVLEQTATSRGAGDAVPTVTTSTDPGGANGGSPSTGVIATGIGLTVAGLGAVGLAGRFAQAGLGGALSGSPPAPAVPPTATAPPTAADLKQFAWDWGGHILGGLVVVASLISAPISATGAAVGVVVVVASEVKRRYWPSKPLTANDMIGGNPYQKMQQDANAGIGQKVRDAHGSADVGHELGPDGNQTTTWAAEQHTAAQDTGGVTQSQAESRGQMNADQ